MKKLLLLILTFMLLSITSAWAINVVWDGKAYTCVPSTSPPPTPPPTPPPPVVTDPPGTVTLQSNVAHEKTLAAKTSQFYKVTLPTACTGGLKQFRVLMIQMSTAGGDGQLLVKSSNQGKASWVTQADYVYEFAQHGYNNPGQDWTRDPNGGAYFYGFLVGGGGETVSINQAYAGHTFSQADTYYVLVTNRGTTSNTYRTSFRCY